MYFLRIFVFAKLTLYSFRIRVVFNNFHGLVINAFAYHSGDVGSRLHFVIFFLLAQLFLLNCIFKSAISYFIAFTCLPLLYESHPGVGLLVGVDQMFCFFLLKVLCFFFENVDESC